HVYNAANGTHLKDLGMSGPTLRTLGYDPDRGYLYVVRRPEANAMEVVVLAPQSDYQEVARMTAPCARSCHLTTMELFVGRGDAVPIAVVGAGHAPPLHVQSNPRVKRRRGTCRGRACPAPTIRCVVGTPMG